MKSIYSAVLILLISSLAQMSCTSSQGKNPKLGSVDGEAVTQNQVMKEGEKEFRALELKMHQTKAAYLRQRHEVMKNTFDRLVFEKLVDMEADSRGISRDELFDTEIGQKMQEPSEAEIDAVYEDNKDDLKVPREEAVASIRNYLKRNQLNRLQKGFMTELEKKYNVVRSLGHVRFDIDVSESPSVGPSSAPVLLVEFSDFQCSYCKVFSETLKKVVKQYGDKVRLVYRHYPLSGIHPDAKRAAEASLCAADQDRFWEMHDLLFENPESLKEEDIVNKAMKLGLNMETFQSCLTSGEKSSLVDTDIVSGAIAGVEGTPTLFVNGRYLNGNRPFEEIAKIIDEELEDKGDF